MYRDAAQLEAGATLQADVCIAGAGPAGITIARELRGKGLRVLLLESGAPEFEQATQDLYKGEATGVGDVKLTGCRVRVFGGTSNWWAGWCRPLEEDDLLTRPWLPRSGWPLTRADLDPYYQRAHATVQIGAFSYDPEPVARLAGKPLLPLDPERVSTVLYQFSPPTNFAKAYGADLEAAEDVEVWFHANVVDVALNDAGQAVTHLACRTLDGLDFTVRANRFVLALGGIETPRVLLAARSQEPAGVGNAQDLVGRHFMEHPHYYTGAFIVFAPDAPVDLYLGKKAGRTVDDDHPGGLDTTFGLALGLPRAAREAAGVLTMAANLIEVDVADYDDTPEAVKVTQAASLLRAPGTRLCVLNIRAEQTPIPQSRVSLLDELDPLGLPRVKLDWQVAEDDLRSVDHTYRAVAAELGRNGLGRLWMPQDADGRYLPPSYVGGCHHLGTARMSERPEDGVVDGDGRVWGLDNLYLAGSSVFPTGGFANPTLTIVALAHRLADLLATLEAS